MIDGADKFYDECAIAGVYGNHEAANLVYLCLYALQHRGQQGTGIAAYDGEHIERAVIKSSFFNLLASRCIIVSESVPVEKITPSCISCLRILKAFIN